MIFAVDLVTLKANDGLAASLSAGRFVNRSNHAEPFRAGKWADLGLQRHQPRFGLIVGLVDRPGIGVDLGNEIEPLGVGPNVAYDVEQFLWCGLGCG